MFGLLNINKPPGPTSHDVVARVRRLIGRKTKVGHAGTLDPFATGVLVVCVGPATRLASFVTDHDKQYETEITFGAASTTDDLVGELTPSEAPIPSIEQVGDVIGEFVGLIDQVPPAHSAIHVNGRRAYELARANEEVDIPSRKVRIDAIEVLAMTENRLRLRIDCGKGTYIRAIARDLGTRLGCPAYCSALTRTAIGAFVIADAAALEDLTGENISDALQSARLAVADWPTITLDDDGEKEIRLGRAVPYAPPAAAPPNVAAIDATGRLVALCTVDGDAGVARPNKVFAAE